MTVEALFHAVSSDKTFFSSIYAFVDKLHTIVVQRPAEARKEELQFAAQKIEDFFREYRPSGDGFYLPPNQTSQNDATVKEIHQLARALAALSDQEFNALKPSNTSAGKRTPVTAENYIF